MCVDSSHLPSAESSWLPSANSGPFYHTIKGKDDAREKVVEQGGDWGREGEMERERLKYCFPSLSLACCRSVLSWVALLYVLNWLNKLCDLNILIWRLSVLWLLGSTAWLYTWQVRASRCFSSPRGAYYLGLNSYFSCTPSLTKILNSHFITSLVYKLIY